MNQVALGKKRYEEAQVVLLPPLIGHPSDVWSFNLLQTEPNYITLKKITGDIYSIDLVKRNVGNPEASQLRGKIILMTMADPGYDWIFTHPIVGFITMYGGINSHMAIRAAELSIAAVIGAGEILYKRWSQAHRLEIDCENKRVQILL
jgi:phosphoenolpyruvate synthase/pyruvate phosphate dikinase